MPVGIRANSKVCVMSLARFFDRVAPAAIMVMGVSLAAAFATVAGV